MVFGGEVFERYLGNEGGAFTDEISVLVKEIKDSTFLPCKDTAIRWPFMNHDASSHSTLYLTTVILDFQPSEPQEINFCC